MLKILSVSAALLILSQALAKAIPYSGPDSAWKHPVCRFSKQESEAGWIADCKWTSGTRYKGGWEKGRPHGQGIAVWPGNDVYKYEEGWRNGVLPGQGIAVWPGNDVYKYEGDWRNGVSHGQGIAVWPRIYIYEHEGGWRNGVPHGYGVAKSVTGERYEGIFLEGSFEGYGRGLGCIAPH